MELVYIKLLLSFSIFKLLFDLGFGSADLIKVEEPETVASEVQGTLRIKH
jgi:hypothetical protein